MSKVDSPYTCQWYHSENYRLLLSIKVVLTAPCCAYNDIEAVNDMTAHLRSQDLSKPCPACRRNPPEETVHTWSPKDYTGKCLHSDRGKDGGSKPTAPPVRGSLMERRQILAGSLLAAPELLGTIAAAFSATGVVAKAGINRMAEIRRAQIEAETRRQEITAETQRAALHEREETKRERIRQQNPPAPPPNP